MSNINDTIPTSGSPALSSDVRSNFVAAKAEIEVLQNGGYSHTGSGYLATTAIKAVDSSGLAFYDDSAVRMFIENGGHIGIGTTNPNRRLTIDDTGTNIPLSIRNTGGGGGETTETIRLDFELNNGTDSFVSARVQIGKEGDFVAEADRDAYFSLHVKGNDALTERVRITSAGKIGFNTSSPALTSNGILDMNADIVRLRTPFTPGSAGAPGNQGETCWDVSYSYTCVAANSWHREAHETW